MSNSIKRLLTAAIGIPLLFVIFKLGGIIFLLFIMVLVLFAQLEYNNILESKNLPYAKKRSIISPLLLVLASYYGYYLFGLFFTGTVITILILELRKTDFNETVLNLGTTLFGLIYLGWFLSHAVLLRNIDHIQGISNYAGKQNIQDTGFFFIVFAVACTFLNDTGAYYTGRTIGTHKLTPKISPGKTIEGTIGGLGASILCGLVVNYIFGSPMGSEWTVFLGLLIGLTAVFGDLVESSIKRGAGIKDSGALLPGHGGVLDRFDSLIFVFPVTYYFVLIYYKLNGVVL